MKVELSEESIREIIVNDLKWHAKHAEGKKMRKACLKVAMYYMTYDECIEHFGTKKTERWWNEQ